MAHQQRVGKLGEDIARRYLTSRGYEIVEQNMRIKEGEIDLVAKKDGWWVFVEVKARSTNYFGYPEEAVTAKKLKRIKRAMIWYSNRNRIAAANSRLDILAIELGKNPPAIRHLKDVLFSR